MTFDQACPSGNIMVMMFDNEPPVAPPAECEECGTYDGHKCQMCKDEISEKTCHENAGKCGECFVELQREAETCEL